MAEFPHLGQQCTQCQTLGSYGCAGTGNFLPLVCESCKEIFCKEHHSVVSHNCPKYVRPSGTGTSASAGVSQSILGKCCFCETSVPDIELVLCDKCLKKYCLAHRHSVSHDCPQNKRTDSSAQPLKRPVMVNTSAPAIKGAKNEGLALKVALMKLKQTASGNSSVPLNERLYFKLSYQKTSHEKQFETKDVFLCNEWSVGKCVDWLATHLALINNNNNPLAPKLVLSSDREDSEPFSMSSSLKQLESEELIRNGDKLCLKYIENQ